MTRKGHPENWFCSEKWDNVLLILDHYKLIVPLLLHALLEKRTFQKKKGMSTRGKCSEGKSIYPWSEEEVQVFM